MQLRFYKRSSEKQINHARQGENKAKRQNKQDFREKGTNFLRVLLSSASLVTLTHFDSSDDCLNSLISRQHRKQDKMYVCMFTKQTSEQNGGGRNGHVPPPPAVD